MHTTSTPSAGSATRQAYDSEDPRAFRDVVSHRLRLSTAPARESP